MPRYGRRVALRVSLATVAAAAGIALLGVQGMRAVTPGASQQRPILIPGIAEPAELRVPPMPLSTPPEQMLVSAFKAAHDTGLKSDDALLSAIGPAMDQIIAKYPDFSGAYVFRVAAACEGSDRTAVLSAVDQALKHIGKCHFAGISAATLYSMHAKIEDDGGDDRHALSDLGKAAQIYVRNGPVLWAGHPTDMNMARDQSNGAGDASVCTSWTEPDMNELVRRFPKDYRAYMLQGLYYSFFNQSKLAIKAFEKAASLDSQSALPLFFLIWTRPAFLMVRLTAGQKQKFQRRNDRIVQGMTTVLATNPNFLPALKSRAEAYYELNKFSEAISDYDKILSLDPSDAGEYNSRANAEMETDDIHGAIDDFGKSIEIMRRELPRSSFARSFGSEDGPDFVVRSYNHESRSDAYAKLHEWGPAIADLDTAISIQFRAFLRGINIHQFRAIYPEYKAASDNEIAHKLQDTFYPNMPYGEFAKGFVPDNPSKGFQPWPSLSHLYVERSDLYLKAGKWRNAAIDFRRVINGFPQNASSVDRWAKIASEGNKQTFVDLKTFNGTNPEASRTWIKQTRKGMPESLDQYEFNCTARQIKPLSVVKYNASGKAISTFGAGEWESVIPDSFGEALFNGTCQSSRRPSQ